MDPSRSQVMVHVEQLLWQKWNPRTRADRSKDPDAPGQENFRILGPRWTRTKNSKKSQTESDPDHYDDPADGLISIGMSAEPCGQLKKVD